MSEPFLAEIIMFGGNFAPRGWALCQGQILSIAQNTALFSLLGTTYGGNGQTTFALPDLRGRVPVGQGQGPGLSPYTLGQAAGTESVTLTQSNLPAAPPITVNCNIGDDPAPSGRPNGRVPATLNAGTGYSSTSDSTMSPGMITGGLAGGQSLPVEIIQPYLCINYIIALEGIFPSRN